LGVFRRWGEMYRVPLPLFLVWFIQSAQGHAINRSQFTISF
jgi:hypothetical protein